MVIDYLSNLKDENILKSKKTYLKGLPNPLTGILSGITINTNNESEIIKGFNDIYSEINAYLSSSSSTATGVTEASTTLKGLVENVMLSDSSIITSKMMSDYLVSAKSNFTIPIEGLGLLTLFDPIMNEAFLKMAEKLSDTQKTQLLMGADENPSHFMNGLVNAGGLNKQYMSHLTEHIFNNKKVRNYLDHPLLNFGSGVNGNKVDDILSTAFIIRAISSGKESYVSKVIQKSQIEELQRAIYGNLT